MKKYGKYLAGLLVLVAVFALGDAYGNGTLQSITTRSRDSQNAGLPAELDYSSVNEVYNQLKNNYDGKLTQEQLLDGIKEGLAEATGDTHTEYFNAEAAKKFDDQLNGTFSGIGAELSKDEAGNIQVVAPIAGFPAEKAGVKAGDIIAQIDGTSTNGYQTDEAVSKIRGKKGTTVKLQIIRDGAAQEISIVRDDIKIPSVTSKTLDGNIGYIQINQFSGDTANLAETAAKQFKDAGVKGMVLDMRSNPGGLLDAAVSVSSLWVPQGKTVLQEKRGDTVIKTYDALGGNILNGVPTVVLIDGGSASASEITAGALKDNGLATLIGTKSYGKGSVQTLVPLDDGGELKVTIARWYRPNGQNIDKKGINPDQEVKLSEENTANGADPQLDAALKRLNP